MSYLLGIDIGTSGTKTCLFNEGGETIASAFAEYPLLQPYPDWAEQEPEAWWKAVKETIRIIKGKVNFSKGDIKGIGLSGQMHGLTLLDKENIVLRPAIIWCDQRTEEQAALIETSIGREKIISYTSNPPLANFTAAKLLWVKTHEPEVYERIDKILLPKDYIRYRLTGEFATEVSDASGTLFFNVEKRNWSKEMIQALEMNADWLPSVYESHVISGNVTKRASEETGLFEGIPVVGGAGDQAAGAIGNGIVRPGIVSISLGTSGVVFAHTDNVKIDPLGRLHTFCHAVPNKWHVMAVTQSAGGSLQWFRNQFGLIDKIIAEENKLDIYNLYSKQAAQINVGSEGLLFLPYLMGERAPHLDPAAKGSFVGLTSRHTKSHMIRSIMEGVSFSLRDCLALIEELGTQAKEVRANGGGAKSAVWRGILADILHTPIKTLEANEGPAFGVALLAGVGTGVYKNVEEACAATVRVAEDSLPNPSNSQRYDAYYQVYKNLYIQLKDQFHVLHRLVRQK